MTPYTIDQLREEFARFGYEWFPFHLIGIRSAADKPDTFDDTFILIDGKVKYEFPCTTNPGVYWLQKWANPKGSAVLKPSQYRNTWQIGLHRGKYEALVQRRPVTVFRDTDRDHKSETGKEDIGFHGINIHRGNKGMVTLLIGPHSAGCQVFQDSKDFDFVLQKCRESGKLEFTYTLLNEF